MKSSYLWLSYLTKAPTDQVIVLYILGFVHDFLLFPAVGNLGNLLPNLPSRWRPERNIFSLSSFSCHLWHQEYESCQFFVSCGHSQMDWGAKNAWLFKVNNGQFHERKRRSFQVHDVNLGSAVLADCGILKQQPGSSDQCTSPSLLNHLGRDVNARQSPTN
jgi:hypothetical protein